MTDFGESERYGELHPHDEERLNGPNSQAIRELEKEGLKKLVSDTMKVKEPV